MRALSCPFQGFVTEEKIGEGCMGSVFRISEKTQEGTKPAAMRVIDLPKSSGIFKKKEKAGTDQNFQELLSWYQRFMHLDKQEYPNLLHIEDIHAEQQGSGGGSRIFLRLPWLKVFLNEFVPDTLPDAQIFRMGESICEALLFYERQGICHLDIHPGNIMMTDSGTIILGDTGPRPLRKEPGIRKQFSAPEVLARQNADHRADIFSLGKILSMLLLPRIGRTIPLQCEGSLREVLFLACVEDPEKRFSSAGKFRDSLMRLEDEIRQEKVRESLEEMETIYGPMPGPGSGIL